MNAKTIVATAATAFAVATVATAASAQVPCTGVNACKGKGFVNAGSTIECTVLKTK